MHIYCINLEKREDRRKTAGIEFSREGLSVEFFPATDGRVDTPRGLYVSPSEYGCAMSHSRIWKDIVDKGYETSIVFEDDVCLISNFRSKLLEVMEDARGFKWDIIHLGPIMPISKERHVDGLALYEGKALGTHAYIISLECARKISVFDTELLQVPVDFQLNRFPLKVLCTGESLAKQESMESEPLVGLWKSTWNGDIGIDRTFDLNYLIRFCTKRFRTLIIFFAAIFVWFFTRV